MMNKKYIYQYLLLPLLVCLMAGTAGCSSDADSTPNGEGSRYVNVTMNIATRATGVPTAGTLLETNIKSIRVYAFSGDDQVGYYYSDVIANPAATHTFSMKIEQIGSSNQQIVDFYLVANEAGAKYNNNLISWKKEMTKTELDDLKFTSLVSSEYLPATLKTTAAIYFDAGTANNSLSCELVHPVGKLGIHFAKSKDVPENATLVVNSITLSNILEYNYWMEGHTLDSPVLKDVSVPLVSTSITVGAQRTSDEVLTEDEFANVLAAPYYPFENPNGVENEEWDNDQAGGSVLNITYTLNGRKQTKFIYMPKIERNDWHDFFFTVKPNAVIDIAYAVAEWDDQKLVQDFEHPQTTCEPINEGDYSANAYWSGENDWTGAFQIKFTMDHPEGAECTVSLSSELEFELQVTDNSGQTYDNGKIISEANKAYIIKVHPRDNLNSENEKKTVNLYISVDGNEWYGEDARILINQDEKWPGAPTYITITQELPTTGDSGN